jgi:hypothetical protein
MQDLGISSADRLATFRNVTIVGVLPCGLQPLSSWPACRFTPSRMRRPANRRHNCVCCATRKVRNCTSRRSSKEARGFLGRIDHGLQDPPAHSVGDEHQCGESVANRYPRHRRLLLLQAVSIFEPELGAGEDCCGRKACRRNELRELPRPSLSRSRHGPEACRAEAALPRLAAASLPWRRSKPPARNAASKRPGGCGKHGDLPGIASVATPSRSRCNRPGHLGA